MKNMRVCRLNTHNRRVAIAPVDILWKCAGKKTNELNTHNCLQSAWECNTLESRGRALKRVFSFYFHKIVISMFFFCVALLHIFIWIAWNAMDSGHTCSSHSYWANIRWLAEHSIWNAQRKKKSQQNTYHIFCCYRIDNTDWCHTIKNIDQNQIRSKHI